MKESGLRLDEILGPVHEQPWSRSARDHTWSLISAKHERRRRRQRTLRMTGAALGLSTCLMVAALAYFRAPPGHADIDWKARSQALEMQLDALPPMAAAASPTDSVNVALQSSLSRLDSSLQAAYDHGASAAELSPLWKRRSELLSDLLRARKGHLIRI